MDQFSRNGIYPYYCDFAGEVTRSSHPLIKVGNQSVRVDGLIWAASTSEAAKIALNKADRVRFEPRIDYDPGPAILNITFRPERAENPDGVVAIRTRYPDGVVCRSY